MKASLDAKTAGDLVRLVIFMVVTTIATGLLVMVIGNVSFGATHQYKAVLTDATGVVTGDDVRVAGVKVGSVEEIEIIDDDADPHSRNAMIKFTVDADTALTESTNVRVRFRNLVGQRYLDIHRTQGSTNELEPGATIPVTRTQPSLDLTVLFNGFKPLFEALSPADINKLSFEIIQVFQGQGGTLESLLGRTASLTQTLADRDQLIGDLLVNLNQTLVIVGNRDAELSELIVNFRNLVSGLNEDRDAILASLDGISDLAVETSDLVTGLRPPLVQDIKQIRRLVTTINKGQCRDSSCKAELDRALKVMPIKFRRIGRTATYKSLFNFYLCEFKAEISLPLAGSDPFTFEYPFPGSEIAERCDLG